MADLAIDIVATILNEVHTICRQMQEFEGLCLSVHRRFKLVSNALEAIPPGELRKLLETYNEKVMKFRNFLNRRKDYGIVHRVCSYRKFADRIQQFHEDIDDLESSIRIITTGMTADIQNQVVLLREQLAKAEVDRAKRDETRAEWETEMRMRLREVHDLQFRLVSDGRALRNDAQRRGAAISAMMIRYELFHRSGVNVPEHIRIMQAAFNEISKLNTTIDTSFSPWFITENDVEYDESSYIDEGAFGKVYRGEWMNGAEVVIKVLLQNDVQGQESFRKELDIWDGLNHPHVIQLYGACDIASPPFFVCEDAKNGNFFHYFRDHGKSQIWRLFYEAAQGLNYLHRNRIIHGDLKCTNILVGADNCAKICDFGLSYVRTASVGLSAQAQSAAIRWKAPETMMQGEDTGPDDYNPRWASDVYSFGMCIWEAFQGEPPFNNTQDDDDIVSMLLDESYEVPPPENLPTEQWEFVRQMVAHDWHQRVKLPDVIDKLREFKEMEAATVKIAAVDMEDITGHNTHFCWKCGANLDKLTDSVDAERTCP